MDILDFFRGVHPWMRLFRILRQLPRTSRYCADVASDDEHAELVAASDDGHDQARTVHPPLQTWTQEAELLALIADLLAYQRADFA